jgi:hypothetical protein
VAKNLLQDRRYELHRRHLVIHEKHVQYGTHPLA